MATREFASTHRGVTALTPRAAIATNTTTVGTEVDTKDFNAVTFFITSGVITDGVFTPLIEESDVSGSGYTAVADLDLTALEASVAFVAADDNVTKKIGYIGTKRYVRLSLVSTGVTSGGFLAANAILTGASNAPVA